MLVDLTLPFARDYKDEALRSENNIPFGGEKGTIEPPPLSRTLLTRVKGRLDPFFSTRIFCMLVP